MCTRDFNARVGELKTPSTCRLETEQKSTNAGIQSLGLPPNYLAWLS